MQMRGMVVIVPRVEIASFGRTLIGSSGQKARRFLPIKVSFWVVREEILNYK